MAAMFLLDHDKMGYFVEDLTYIEQLKDLSLIGLVSLFYNYIKKHLVTGKLKIKQHRN